MLTWKQAGNFQELHNLVVIYSTYYEKYDFLFYIFSLPLFGGQNCSETYIESKHNLSLVIISQQLLSLQQDGLHNDSLFLASICFLEVDMFDC